MALKIRRIDCSTQDAQPAIAALRAELSPKGNVVSPEGKARTIAAFGEPLAPRQVVERICSDVAARGLDGGARLFASDRRRDARTGSGARLGRRATRRPIARPIRAISRRSHASGGMCWRIRRRSGITT